MDPYIGEIRMFVGNYAPSGNPQWMFCNGQLLSIAQYQLLYSVLGTIYGGNGVTDFALPDLRGRIPIGDGQGPNLTLHALGDKVGTETEVLTTNMMPAHKHFFAASTSAAVNMTPTGNIFGETGNNLLYEPITGDEDIVPLAPQAIQLAGGSQAHNNMMPYLCISFIICVDGGVYPVRP